MPFLLRRSAENGSVLVGDCYLHGVMDGELVHSVEGQDVWLEAKYIEMDRDGRQYSIRMRP